MAGSDEFLEYVSDDSYKRLKDASAELMSQIESIKMINNLTSQAKTPGASDEALKALREEYDKQAKSIQELQNQLQKLSEAQKKKAAQNTQEIVDARLQRAEDSRRAVSTSELAGAYKVLSAQQAIAKDRYRDLIVAGKQADQTQAQYNNELKTASANFEQLNQRVLSADKAVGVFGRNVGNYPLAGLATGLKSLIGAFGLTSGIYLFVGAIKSGFDTLREFEKANADLAAYMGKTRAEITGLTDDQKSLAVATRYTAVEIAGVQKDLAKSGFNVDQIKLATGYVLNFASAIGTDTSTAIQVVDTVLKTFNLTAASTGDVTNIMAKSFTSSRLRIDDFKEAISYVAPVATALNVPFSKVVAMLSVLADNGIKGSQAGTALRKTMLDLTKSGKDFSESLDDVNKKQISVNEGLGLVGTRAVTTLLVLNKHAEAVKNLSKEYENLAGVTDKMAKEQLDTLDGKIHILTSSWEVFVLSLDSGNGQLSNLFKGAITRATQLINLLTEVNEGYKTPKQVATVKTDQGYKEELEKIAARQKQNQLSQDDYDTQVKISQQSFLAGKITQTQLNEQLDLLNQQLNTRSVTQQELMKEVELQRDYAKEQRDSYKEQLDNLEAFAEKKRKIAVEGKATNIGGGNYTGTTESVAALQIWEKTRDKIRDVAAQYGYYNGVLKATYETLQKVNNVNTPNQAKDTGLKESTKAAKDYAAAIAEVTKAQLENAIKYNTEIMNDDTKTFAFRKEASEQLLKDRLQLIKLEYDEVIRSNAFKLNDDLRIAKAEKDNVLSSKKASVEDREAAEKEYTDKVYGLNQQSTYKLLLNDIKYNDAVKTLKEDEFKTAKQVQDKIDALSDQKQINIISEKQLNDLRQLNLLLVNISPETTEKQFKAIADLRKSLTEDSERQILEIQIQSNDRMLEKYEYSTTERANLETKLKEATENTASESNDFLINLLKDRLNSLDLSYFKDSEEYAKYQKIKDDLLIKSEDLKAKSAEAEAQRLLNLKKATQDYLKSFSETLFSGAGFGSLSKFFDTTFDGITGKSQTTFEKLYEGAETSAQKFAVVFNSIAEVAQDAFNIIGKASAQKFDAEKARLQQEHDIAIAFAGDSATAKAEIDRQYAARKAEIEKKEARQKKQLAIFNVIIDTAEAVVSQLAEDGYAAAILAGILGAAQIAIIESEPLPQLYVGTDNAPGGLAWTNEKGAEIITDKDGNIKDMGTDKGAKLMNLDKGDKVYTADQTKQIMHNNVLNSILDQRGILQTQKEFPEFPINEFRNVGTKIERAILSAPSSGVYFDEYGYRKFVQKNGQKTESMNRRLNGVGVKR